VSSGTSRLDRLLAAYPLLLAYVLLLILYAWQTTKHSTPWLFTDELQWAEQSRAVAHHGVQQLRGHDVPFDSLYPYLTAPAWWASTTSGGYAAAKYINAIVMTASIFPGYALARLFVPRWPAIACGVATAAIPSLAYVTLLIPEPFAYFWATLALWLVARAFMRRSWGAAASGAAALVVAPYVRGELVVLFVVGLVIAVGVAVTSENGRALIASWTLRERLGVVLLLIGGLIVFGAAANQHSVSWRLGTHFHDRAFTYGLWAAGAFTIGVGVLPVVVALAWLLGNRFTDVEDRVLGTLLVGSVIAFGIYTAVKASYISTYFAVRVEERNLIYVAPVVFAVVARWALTARTRIIPVVLAAAAVWYLLDTTPYHNNEDFYSDAPGLTVLQWLNRHVSFTTADARRLLFGILIGSVVVLLGTDRLVRRRRLGRLAVPAGAVLALLVVGWNLGGEASAADASNRFARGFRSVLPTPPDWIDRTTGIERTMFIGQSMQASNGFWSLEFWNQSIQDVWSTDATAPPPGPTITPDYADTTGVVFPQLPLDWIVVTPGIDPVGKLIAPVGGLRLFRVPHPIRLEATTIGLSSDASWMSTAAAFVRFGARTAKPGVATVTLSRTAACGTFAPSPVTIRISRLRIDSNHQPAAGRLLAERRVVVTSTSCGARAFTFRVRPPFRIDLSASRTFLAADGRQLSAQVGFDYKPS
jgi:hypothetical protein